MWVNGNESLIQKNPSSRRRILSKVVLAPGDNYICSEIKIGRKLWGRTPMVRVKSSVRPSIARFELSWDGQGDIDLHLDNVQKGIRINYTRKTHNANEYELNLDVDNTRAFGPENIRLFTIPENTEFRCFLNYYSGRATLNATVRMFDKDNKLIKTVKKRFLRKDVKSSSRYNGKSKLVGKFMINTE
jgi:hypothetical protein